MYKTTDKPITEADLLGKKLTDMVFWGQHLGVMLSYHSNASRMFEDLKTIYCDGEDRDWQMFDGNHSTGYLGLTWFPQTIEQKVHLSEKMLNLILDSDHHFCSLTSDSSYCRQVEDDGIGFTVNREGVLAELGCSVQVVSMNIRQEEALALHRRMLPKPPRELTAEEIEEIAVIADLEMLHEKERREQVELLDNTLRLDIRIGVEDYIKVATEEEKIRYTNITDVYLEKELAQRWCDVNRYKLGGYLGNGRWDATRRVDAKKNS